MNANNLDLGPANDDELDVIPPNFDLCELHREANYMRKINEGSSSPNKSISELVEGQCRCCGKDFRAPKYGICDDPKLFAIHGFGISLYFSLVKYLIYISCLLLIACGAILLMYCNGGIYENNLFNQNEEINMESRIAGDMYYQTYTTRWSIGRVIKSQGSAVILLGCCFLILAYFFSWVRFQNLIEMLDMKLNIDNLTPADYTVMLTGLPADIIMTDQELAAESETLVTNVLKRHIESDIPIKVAKVIPVYSSYRNSEESEKLTTLKKQKAAIDRYRLAYRKRAERKKITVTDEEVSNAYPDIYKRENYVMIVSQIEELQRTLAHNENAWTDLPKGSERAFITFTRTLADDILEAYPFASSFRKCWGRNELFTIRGAGVSVAEAPEPEDVNWENMTCSPLEKMCRVVLNWIVTAGILAVCLIINIFISDKNTEYSEDSGTSRTTLVGLNILFSSICILINMVLCYAIPITTKLERLSTKTGYDASVSFKLSFALFLNSGVIPIITYRREAYFMEGGFLMSVWLNWLCICLLNPLMELFDVFYFLRCYKWSKIKQEGKDSMLTQREANIALEPYSVSMTTKFAQTISIMFYTSFYALLFPPGILITIAGYFVQYWVSKILMTYRYKVPHISGDIAVYTMNLTGTLCTFLFATSGVIYVAKLCKQGTMEYAVAIAVLIVLALFLMMTRYILRLKGSKNKRTLFTKLFLGDNTLELEFYDKFKNVEYDSTRFGRNDYKTLNPATEKFGMQELMTEYAKKAKTEEERNKYLAMQRKYQEGSEGFNSTHENAKVLPFAYPQPVVVMPIEMVVQPNFPVAPDSMRVLVQPVSP